MYEWLPWPGYCREDKEFQAILGPCPEGVSVWLEREAGLSIRGCENKHTPIAQIQAQAESLRIKQCSR